MDKSHNGIEKRAIVFQTQQWLILDNSHKRDRDLGKLPLRGHSPSNGGGVYNT